MKTYLLIVQIVFLAFHSSTTYADPSRAALADQGAALAVAGVVRAAREVSKLKNKKEKALERGNIEAAKKFESLERAQAIQNTKSLQALQRNIAAGQAVKASKAAE